MKSTHIFSQKLQHKALPAALLVQITGGVGDNNPVPPPFGDDDDAGNWRDKSDNNSSGKNARDR